MRSGDHGERSEYSPDRRERLFLCLLGGFRLLVGDSSRTLSLPSQRLLALLALDDTHTRGRSVVAGTLWPDSNEKAARSNLRSALFDLGELREGLIDATATTLRLQPRVFIDLPRHRRSARKVLDGQTDRPAASPEYFKDDLLPQFDEIWLEAERESYRQLRLHALEALSALLVREGRFAEAVEAGLLAIAGSPLRESAYLALIRALAAEGNRGEALLYYQRLRRLLRGEVGLDPSFSVPGDLG